MEPAEGSVFGVPFDTTSEDPPLRNVGFMKFFLDEPVPGCVMASCGPFDTSFLMEGELTIPATYDLVGHGNLHVFKVQHTTIWRYTFVAPEPATWGLLLVAILTLALGHTVRRTMR